MSAERPILVAEDDESTAELARRSLVRAKRTVRTVRRVDAALELLANERFELAILDFRLEDGDAWPILDAAYAASPRIPVILVTAQGDEKLAAEALHRGASEYVIKSGSFWEKLPAMADRVARAARIENENALLASVVHYSEDAIIAGSLEGRIESWNPAAERIFGYRTEEVLGRPLELLFPPERRGELRSAMDALDIGGATSNHETVRRRKDGSLLDVAESISPIFDPAGRPAGVSVVVRDIAERKRLEAQFRQAQKMEAVGRLAGGVAHDFNNLLTVINGYSAMALQRLDATDPLRRDIEQVRKAGERAAALTHQLLAFSREQVFAPKAIDLNAVVRDMETLLHRMIGEDVELTASLAQPLGRVMADVGQIEQVIINLAVNARDAMPRGGALTIATGEADLDEKFAQGHTGIVPGRHVVLRVTDTGHGIDETTRAHLFEPFFTTKEVGKGTGLGLATVHGIVRQSGGAITVTSEPGRGATFEVYLPRVDALAEEVPPDAVDDEALGGMETILVAEDDPGILDLVRAVLTAKGYRVLVARDGREALTVSAAHAGPIDLLVTDVVMRSMGGWDLANKIALARPETKVLLMSGYTRTTVTLDERIASEARYLEKPFSPNQLLRRVRETLGAPRR